MEFLGEQMQRMQVDLRGVRAEQVKLESEVRGLDGKIDAVGAKVEAVDRKVGAVAGKVDRLESKVDAHNASSQARFDQIDRTMAMNLEVMLKALRVRAGEAKRALSVGRAADL